MSSAPMQLDAAEQALLDSLRAGDEAAYETLVRDFGGPMLAVTRRMLGNEDDARDALQDAFLSAFKAIDRFQGGSKLSTWLHRIAVNASLMKLRTKRRRSERSIEAMLPQYDESGHRVRDNDTWPTDGAIALQRQETRQQVRDAIDELPESYRTVLLLRDIEELNTKETADMLDVSESVVKTRLHRARLALRNLLAETFGTQAE